MPSPHYRAVILGLLLFAATLPARSAQPATQPTSALLRDYFERMSAPRPIPIQTGADLKARHDDLKKRLLQIVALDPLPQRISLDPHESKVLDHPWCTVRRVAYQLWPGVYSTGLLYMPKDLPERPAPAMLCPHGHWDVGNAHPSVQARCLMFARLGYVTFSPTQNHYEDLAVGVSHQTLMIWTNMRALDYLQSLPNVDPSRIGVAGESGGGLQTQMIIALDPRPKAATIVGLTCDFREIMFPDHAHCVCNHFPGVLQFTDHPEISTLGLPAAVQYLTMNDWTRTFEEKSFPAIQALYAANKAKDRVQCIYYDTPHTYDRPKREATYVWMEKWVRGRTPKEPIREPDEIATFPPETLTSLRADVPADKGFEEIGRIFRKQHAYSVPHIRQREDWETYRKRMTVSLRELLGEEATLPRDSTAPRLISSRVEDGLILEDIRCPSEGPLQIPAWTLRPQNAPGKLPVIILCSAFGRSALPAERGPDSPRQLARDSLVVLPDLRCYGEMLSTGTDDKQQMHAWQRNAIVWGRPIPAMAATDLRAVLDGVARRDDVDTKSISVVVRASGGMAIAAIFAVALDTRIASLDIDLAGACFEKRNLPDVPFILWHGDVLQWSALCADRNLRLRNLPRECGNPQWFTDIARILKNEQNVRIDPQ